MRNDGFNVRTPRLEYALVISDDESRIERDVYRNGKWIRRERLPKRTTKTRKGGRK